MTQDIGMRMKSYESNRRLEKGAVIIRIDGKAFHTWTKQIGAKKPFDRAVITSMHYATRKVAEQMQGFRLAYTQSDESTFLLTNLGENEQSWFGGKADKLISVTSSMFTYYFNEEFRYWTTTRGYKEVPAFFDARAFNIPIEDAANCFYWRQIDWLRNSISMLGRAHFSHKELLNKSAIEVKNMLLEKGIDWEDLEVDEKYGTFVLSEMVSLAIPVNYEQINRLAAIDVT
jgi:tRNA(His) guanylyltransferase